MEVSAYGQECVSTVSLESDTESPEKARMKVQIWQMLVEAGFEDKATERVVNQLLEELNNDTLESEQQLAVLLGVRTVVPQTSGVTENAIVAPKEEEEEYVDEIKEEFDDEEDLNESYTVQKSCLVDADTDTDVGKYNTQDENPVIGDETTAFDESGSVKISQESPPSFKKIQKPQTSKASKSWRKKKLHECPNCDEVFSRKEIFVKHLRSHSYTGKEPMYTCSVCDRWFKDEFRFLRHQKFTKCGSIAPKCDICEREFKSIFMIRKHVWLREELKAFQCSICGELFCSKSLLVCHQKCAHVS